MTISFRLGITPDFYNEIPGLVDPVIAECMDGVDGVTYARMPDVGAVATSEQIAEFDGVFNNHLTFAASTFSGHDRLAVIARWGVGYDMIDVDACTANDVALCITPPGVKRPVAEATVTMVLALSKHLTYWDRRTRAGEWRGQRPRLGVCLQGRVLGSVGLGNIGVEMMRLLQPFGLARRLAFDPYANPAAVAREGVELVDLDTLLRESDFVTILCPLNKETYHLIGPRELGLMKPTAYLVNTARGAIVDGEALAEVLAREGIAGAALDVFEQEPVDPGDPLLRQENAIVSPHAIAWTEEIVRDNGRIALEACLAVARGEEPAHVVNREVLERPGFKAKLARFKR